MTKPVENITDVIDLEYLQAIQDSLGRIVGITTVLLDPGGVPISAPTNLHAFCAMMQASEKGRTMCIASNGKLIEKIAATREPAVITCPNSGLKTAAVPVFLGDDLLGCWLIGQIRMSDVDEKLIERTATNAGISKEEAKRNIEALPVISKQEFEDTLSFLVTVSKALTDLVETNGVLNKRNVELEILTDKLDRSLLAFKSFIDFTEMGAYLVDFETGELIMCNETFRRLFDVEEGMVGNAACYSLLGFDDFCPFCEKDTLVDENGIPTKSRTWESYNTKLDQWLSVTSRVIPWIDGRLVLMTTLVDITNRKSEEERIAYLAYNDQRLDIANNVKLYLDISDDTDTSCMICFDVQGLRKINDAYGRDAGDFLLHSIVDWIQGHYTSEDITLYRIDGGGFVMRLQKYSQKQAMEIANKLMSRFENAWSVDMNGFSQNIYTGVHVGVIKTPTKLEDLSALLNLLERVLSFARDKSGVVLFDDATNQALATHIQFEVELKSCVLNDMEGFFLNYQPIVDIETDDWVGLEALCRWNRPSAGLVSPVIFIPEAERLGLIDFIDDWVMEQAIKQVKAWGLDEFRGFILDINLSPVQLRNRNLVKKVSALLKKYDFPADKLNLEITETSELYFDNRTLKVLERIKAEGVSLSLDDFGSGYATLSNLNNLPVDCLKTDRSFVVGIEHDQFLQQAVRSITELARAAGLMTIAEGVETETQRSFMVENGVDRIQGFYYSRPLSVDVLEKKLGLFRETA